MLSREEVSRLINAAETLFRRTLLMTLYGTGMRRAKLAILREYWRWRKLRLYLFPTRTLGRRVDQPISDKTVWIACSEAARRAGIKKAGYAA